MRKRRAEILLEIQARIENLPLVRGLPPHPCALRQLIDPSYVDSYREFDCPSYDNCVNLASHVGWMSFSCRGCQVKVVIEKKKYVKKERKVTVEHKSKSKKKS